MIFIQFNIDIVALYALVYKYYTEAKELKMINQHMAYRLTG